MTMGFVIAYRVRKENPGRDQPIRRWVVVIKRIIRLVALTVPFVVVGILLSFTFVPRDETETIFLNVPEGVALLDHNGTAVRKVSVATFFDLDLKNPIMYVTSRPGKATLIYLGVGKDTQGNSVVYRVEEVLGYDGLGHRIEHSVNVDQETVTINRNVDILAWSSQYGLILVAVFVVALTLWRLVVDHVLTKKAR